MTSSSMYSEFFTSSMSRRFRSYFTKKEKKEAIRAHPTQTAIPYRGSYEAIVDRARPIKNPKI
jgi:hypothetical protein